MNCPNCGLPITAGSRLCTSCGFAFEDLAARQTAPVQQPAPQRPVYAQPQQPVYTPPRQPVYTPPQQPVYAPPRQPVYAQPQQPVYAPPQQPVNGAQPRQNPAAYQPAPVYPVQPAPAAPSAQQSSSRRWPIVLPLLIMGALVTLILSFAFRIGLFTDASSYIVTSLLFITFYIVSMILFFTPTKGKPAVTAIFRLLPTLVTASSWLIALSEGNGSSSWYFILGLLLELSLFVLYLIGTIQGKPSGGIVYTHMGLTVLMLLLSLISMLGSLGDFMSYIPELGVSFLLGWISDALYFIAFVLALFHLKKAMPPRQTPPTPNAYTNL